MPEYKQLDMRVGSDADFEAHKTEIPEGSLFGSTDLINENDLSESLKAGFIKTISTSTVRIWGLETGVYRLTYNGNKTLYYYGSSGTSSVTISDINPLLFVEKSSSSVTTWWIVTKPSPTSSSVELRIRYGSTYSSSGNQHSFILPDGMGSSGQFLKSNGDSSAPSWATVGGGGGGSVFQHHISMEDSNGLWYTLVLYSSSSSYIQTAYDFEQMFGGGSFPMTPPYPEPDNSGILAASYVTAYNEVNAIRYESSAIISYVYSIDQFFDDVKEV